MDIYLPRLRTIIETKKVGKAGIEVLEQLEPYVHSRILEEQNYLPFHDGIEQNRRWTGVITDGQTWWMWKWENRENSPAREEKTWNTREPEDILDILKELFQDSPLGKPRIPQNPYGLFTQDLKDLEDIHSGLTGQIQKETQTKFDLWQDMLRASGMEPENENDALSLFVKHSFLVSIARNVSHILVDPDPEKDPNSVLNDGFASWIVQDTDGEDWQKALLAKINQYDWRRQKGDVLRSVYEGFISAKDRKIFGEHYTPDWLAELLVHEILDPEWLEQSIQAATLPEPLKGIGVLDPACGSGTFLYHSARKILESKAMKDLHLPLSRQAEIVVRLVHGIDIHPIAAEISRATLLRALPTSPPDGTKSIRVFQGDSLMTFQDKEDSDKPLLDRMRHTIREKNLCFFLPGTKTKEIQIPISFCELPSFNFDMDRLIEFAKREQIPQDILRKIPEEDQSNLEQSCKDFAAIIAEKGNSVWAWYVINITAPAFLARRKINRIVANPPWVKMANIQVPYRKKELENAFKNENLWFGGKMAPHNDIAQLFVKICRKIYLEKPETNPAAWIVKKSALKSSQWEKFREWYENISAQIADLTKVQPFGSGCAKESVILFDIKKIKQTQKIVQEKIETKIILAEPISSKQKPNYNANLNKALELLKFDPAKSNIPVSVSDYKGDQWRQGAVVIPSVLVIAQSIIPKTKTTSDISTRQSRHKPWRDISIQKGEVKNEWLRNLIKSLDMFPFMISENPNKAIIPINGNGEILENPEKVSEFWRKVNKIFIKYRSIGSSTPQNLIKMINHQKVLTKQIERTQNLKNRSVLYPGSGDIMRASRITLASDIIIDTSLYHQTFSSQEEAAYLVSLLNNPGLTDAFASARRSDRHFHTHVWKYLPIPKFDPKNQGHKRLAELCEEAEKATETWYHSNPEHAKYRQQKASAEIRKMLQESRIFDQINQISRKILPDQTQ